MTDSSGSPFSFLSPPNINTTPTSFRSPIPGAVPGGGVSRSILDVNVKVDARGLTSAEKAALIHETSEAIARKAEQDRLTALNPARMALSR